MRAPFNPIGIIVLVAVLVLVASMIIVPAYSSTWRRVIIRWLGIFVLVTVCVGLLLPPVSRPGESGAHLLASSRLIEIGRAFHRYADKHDHRLPPAAVSGKDGRSLLSWRVLLLPYLGEEELFQQFKLNEPWDSLDNLALLPRMPEVYASLEREDEQIDRYSTFYQAFIGNGTAFELKDGPRFPDDFPDGTSSTILVAEAGQPVPWTKPAELLYAAAEPLPRLGGVFKGRGRFQGYGRNWSKGFYVIFADGSGRFVTDSTSEATLRAAITRNGGEPMGGDW